MSGQRNACFLKSLLQRVESWDDCEVVFVYVKDMFVLCADDKGFSGDAGVFSLE